MADFPGAALYGSNGWVPPADADPMAARVADVYPGVVYPPSVTPAPPLPPDNDRIRYVGQFGPGWDR